MWTALYLPDRHAYEGFFTEKEADQFVAEFSVCPTEWLVIESRQLREYKTLEGRLDDEDKARWENEGGTALPRDLGVATQL